MVIIILIAFVVTKYGTHVYVFSHVEAEELEGDDLRAARSSRWTLALQPVIMHSPIKIRVFNYVCARRDFPLFLHPKAHEAVDICIRDHLWRIIAVSFDYFSI
jgi:hypothetical protein